MLLKFALNYFIKRLQQEPDYAWGWHSNIAMSIYDTMEESDGVFANKCAARIMKHLFDIDMTKNEYYIGAMENWSKHED